MTLPRYVLIATGIVAGSTRASAQPAPLVVRDVTVIDGTGDGDPLVDIRNVGRIDAVIARGELYNRAKLSALLAH